MPVVFRDGSLRYFFYSNEGSPRESPHIHVKGAGSDAKVRLVPEVAVVDSYGFNSRDLSAYHPHHRGQPRPHPAGMA
ncbi:DUF4160 domain-containing protein [Xanthobacteraceae bacterium Astr-EGSB]|uniref:DUF4160 domain-containing protein n=1 Tax=Astrobacterium formosum TaxID=3069710 RepID=UPI0027B80B03|nr:DUF4160 domain-containing protein [Xanthobacteraceae bacterium Astr-EGSB]